MAAKIFTQNPSYTKKSPFLKNSQNSHQKHHFSHLSLPKNTFKTLAISSSTISPPISFPQIPNSSPKNPNSSPQSPNSTPQNPDSSPQNPNSSPQNPNSSPQNNLSFPLPLSQVWREIQGCNNWENLIDPLNPLLQQEITRYGNLLSATYKGFDLNPNSKRYLSCKFSRKNFLKETKTHNPHNYQITKYIYATPDVTNPIQNQPNRARWIGYIAVSSDKSGLGRRDIVVTFRGTVTNSEWLTNLKSSLTSANLDPHNLHPNVKVESGFLSLYTSTETGKFAVKSCREQILSEISRLLNKHKEEEMSITLAGHSMGSSLAQILAYDIAELGLNRRKPAKNTVPVTVFSFAGPRVGNLGFKKRCEELGVKVLRIANVNDPITKLPGVLFNENFRALGGVFELPWSCSCYTHVGVELTLDFFDVQNISCVHDLQTYIDLVKCPKSSRSVDGEDRFSSEFLGFKIAATNAVNLLGTVSNHMMYCNIF